MIIISCQQKKFFFQMEMFVEIFHNRVSISFLNYPVETLLPHFNSYNVDASEYFFIYAHNISQINFSSPPPPHRKKLGVLTEHC